MAVFLGFSGLGFGREGYSQFLYSLCPDCHSVCPDIHIHQINSTVKALYVLFICRIWSFLWLFSFFGSADYGDPVAVRLCVCVALC
jgi:hypothetical protein